MIQFPPSIKDIRVFKKEQLSGVLYKGHCMYGGIRKKLRMPQAAPTTPPHRPDNSAPPSIKVQRRALEEARKQLPF